MSIQTIKKHIAPILRREEVQKAAIFGSFARGEQTKNSDIDIVIKMKPGKSLFDLVGLKIALEKKLHKSVDLLTYNSINPKLRDEILEQQQVIYEKKS